MKLPFFPLQSVFFPGETVPLHIFEERYKEEFNYFFELGKSLVLLTDTDYLVVEDATFSLQSA